MFDIEVSSDYQYDLIVHEIEYYIPCTPILSTDSKALLHAVFDFEHLPGRFITALHVLSIFIADTVLRN